MAKPKLKRYWVLRGEVTRLIYAVEAESPEAAHDFVTNAPDDSLNEHDEVLMGQQTLQVRCLEGRKAAVLNCGAVLMVNAREHAHILAGLRLLQRDPGDLCARVDAIRAYAESEGHAEMTDAELDALAARLNA